MKMLKLNYYNAEIYEKYKINNILSLLVDKHKLQNESLGFNDLGNKQNNYSIIALLGSQIKNINDEEYKNIDTNDIIFALSELKRLDEHITYNESKNKNYILEMAKQMYYEYSHRGLISKENNYNFNCPHFMDINLELMNEINKEVKQYENKIFNLRAYSDEEKRKRDSLSHIRSNTSSATSVLNMNENENNIYISLTHKSGLHENDHEKMSCENLHEQTNEFISKNTQDASTINEVRRPSIKGEKSEHEHITGDSYENYINLKKKKKSSHMEENNIRDKYGELNKDNMHTMNYMNKEDISTHYNSNDLLPNDIFLEHNNINGINERSNVHNPTMEKNINYYTGRLSRLSSHNNDNNKYKDLENIDFLKRKTVDDRKEEERSESNYRSTINSNMQRHAQGNMEGGRRKSVCNEQNEKYSNDLSPYNNFTNKYEREKSLISRDTKIFRKDENLKRMSGVTAAEDNMSTHNPIYGIHSKNNTSRFILNNATRNSTNSVLENIDKAEQKLVTNHLKNSFAHNETIARRMSSMLLNPTIHSQDMLPKNLYEINGNNINSNGSVRKYTNTIRCDNNSIDSINKYSTASNQLNHYASGSNNDSSVIINSINNRANMNEESYKRISELDNVNYMNRDKQNSTKDINSNYPTNFNNFEPSNSITNHINNKISSNVDNLSAFTRKYSKGGKAIPHIYTSKYSRALDINDLNSNTSRNYINSTNSVKSDYTNKDTYSKMYERSKSLTSQLNKLPLSHKYLKANI